MYCTRKVTDDLIWVGADDRRLACFEGVYGVPDGVSYNSYVMLDEKRPFSTPLIRPSIRPILRMSPTRSAGAGRTTSSSPIWSLTMRTPSRRCCSDIRS